MSAYGLVGMARASAVWFHSFAVAVLGFPPLLVEAQSPQLVFVPGDFVLAHPERLELDFDLRPFVGLAALLAGRAAHLERAAGDRHHVELHVGALNLLGVRLHARLVLGLGSPDSSTGLGIHLTVTSIVGSASPAAA